MSEKAAKLVYTTETGGVSQSYEHESGPDTEVYQAAELLANWLYEEYAEGFDRVLEAHQTGTRVREFLRERGMDKPRVEVYTSSQYRDVVKRGLATVENADSHRAEVDRLSAKYATLDGIDDRSVVVNFQLPKPLDIFWWKKFWNEEEYWRHEPTEEEVFTAAEDRRLMNEWGGMYEYLMGTPWWVVDQWADEYGERFGCDRINDVGIHGNGDNGFYYLFEIYERDSGTHVDHTKAEQPDVLDRYDKYDPN